MMTKVGVLALQGDFEEHAQRLQGLGCETIELRCAADLDHVFDALVLPGGESTVQAALLAEFEMLEPMQKMITEGIPVFATCAGLVLLAQEVSYTNGEQGNDARIEQTRGTIATLPVCVRRNAYGRQLASFHAVAPFRESATSTYEDAPCIPMTFIRAPLIDEVGDGVEVLATIDDAIVAVLYANQLGITFHPELDDDDTIYQLFLDLVEKRA
jgi:5'-phosphate synthase pdxT subunit